MFRFIIYIVTISFLLISCSTSKKITRIPQEKPTKEIRHNSTRNIIVKNAYNLKKTKYKYGGNNPNEGFDCSGFTKYVFQKSNITLHRISRDQAKQGIKRNIKNLKKGDLIFFGKHKKVSHVAIVSKIIGNQIFVIHSTSSRGVIEEDIMKYDYWKKRILFAKDVIQ